MPHCNIHGKYVTRPQIVTKSRSHEQRCPKCAAEELHNRSDAFLTPTSINAIAAFESGLSKRFRFASLKNFAVPTAEHKRYVEIGNRFVSRFGGKEPFGGIVLLGEPGVGKTHFAIAIGRELAEMGLTPCYLTVANLIKRVRASWGEQGGESIELSKLTHYDLLIIDEVGVQTGSANEKQIICEVIDGRYNLMRPTILISNLDINGVSSYVSERSVSRVLERGMQLPFNVKSYREVAA